MKKIIFISFAVFLFATTPMLYQKKLGIGIDVNWCNFKQYVNKSYYKKGVKIFSLLGFRHVRIRFNGVLYRNNPKKMLDCLKNSVNYALKYNLIPIITYVDKSLANNPSNKNILQAVRTWGRIAFMFRDYPDSVSYDLYIEPNHMFGKKADRLLEFYKKSIMAIRKIDKNKILFVAPLHIANPYDLNCLEPIIKNPKLNKNLMIEWHFYAGGPSKKNQKKLWTSGTKYEKNLIDKKIDYAYKWCKQHHMYGWVGAIMPGNYNHGDNYSIKEQINFIKYVILRLKEKGIPLAINADWQFYDYKNNTLKRKQVLNSILKFN